MKLTYLLLICLLYLCPLKAISQMDTKKYNYTSMFLSQQEAGSNYYNTFEGTREVRHIKGVNYFVYKGYAFWNKTDKKKPNKPAQKEPVALQDTLLWLNDATKKIIQHRVDLIYVCNYNPETRKQDCQQLNAVYFEYISLSDWQEINQNKIRYDQIFSENFAINKQDSIYSELVTKYPTLHNFPVRNTIERLKFTKKDTCISGNCDNGNGEFLHNGLYKVIARFKNKKPEGKGIVVYYPNPEFFSFAALEFDIVNNIAKDGILYLSGYSFKEYRNTKPSNIPSELFKFQGLLGYNGSSLLSINSFEIGTKITSNNAQKLPHKIDTGQQLLVYSFDGQYLTNITPTNADISRKITENLLKGIRADVNIFPSFSRNESNLRGTELPFKLMVKYNKSDYGGYQMFNLDFENKTNYSNDEIGNISNIELNLKPTNENKLSVSANFSFELEKGLFGTEQREPLIQQLEINKYQLYLDNPYWKYEIQLGNEHKVGKVTLTQTKNTEIVYEPSEGKVKTKEVEREVDVVYKDSEGKEQSYTKTIKETKTDWSSVFNMDDLLKPRIVRKYNYECFCNDKKIGNYEIRKSVSGMAADETFSMGLDTYNTLEKAINALTTTLEKRKCTFYTKESIDERIKYSNESNQLGEDCLKSNQPINALNYFLYSMYMYNDNAGADANFSTTLKLFKEGKNKIFKHEAIFSIY